MTHRFTYYLLALFFVGLLALWWADSAGIKTAPESERLSQLVLPGLADVPSTDVTRVEISGGGRPSVVVERRGADRWQLVGPVEFPADRGKVEGLIASLKHLRKSPDAGTISESSGNLGLDESRNLRLFGTNRDRPLAELDVGDARILKGSRYVRPDHGGIEVVEALALGPVDQPVNDWRQRNLFTIPTLDIARIQVGGPGRVLVADREGGKWHLREPIPAPGDPDRLDAVLADLTALRVEDGDRGFVADRVRDFAPFGLDQPSILLELSSGTGPKGMSQVVQIGKAVEGQADRAYARWADRDNVVLVNPKSLSRLGKEPNDLRSRKVADFDKEAVDFLAIRIGDQDHELARTSAGWVVVRRDSQALKALGKADGPLVQTLLARLDGLQTSEFLDPARYPEASLDKPAITVKVWRRNPHVEGSPEKPSPPQGDPVLDLVLGRRNATAKVVYARTAGDPKTLLALPDTILDDFPAGPLAYRDRTILAEDRFGFKRFLIRRKEPGGVREFVLQAPASAGSGADAFGRWRMTRPVEATAEGESVARLAVLLSALRAEGFAAESANDLARYGLDAPPLVVSWTTRSGPTERTLSIGKEVPGSRGSRFAAVSGDTRVFTIPSRAVEILDAEFHDRRVLEFSLDRVRRVTITWPDREVSVDRDPKSNSKLPGWLPVPGADLSGFEPARINPLMETLSSLKAGRFVQYDGPIAADAGLKPSALAVRVTLDGEASPRTLRLGVAGPRLAGEPTRLATTASGPTGPVLLLVGAIWDIWAVPPPDATELPPDVFAPGP